ncbi:MAG: hypothetical protein ACKVKF_13725 [Rhodobacterales bacterium]
MTAPASSTTPLRSERRVSLIGALLDALGPVAWAIYTPAMRALVPAGGGSMITF